MALISMNFDKACTATIPTVVEVFAAMTPLGYVILSIATLLSLFTCLVFMDELYFIHVKVPYKSHKERLYWLIGIFPVYSMTSLLGIYVPRAGVLVDFVASVYLSISVFQFFQLIVEYFGGKSCTLEILSDTPIPLQSPPLACCCPCLPKVFVNKKNFTRLKAIVFQTALVRPLLIFIASVLWTDGSYTPGQIDLANAYLYLTIMTSISTIIGMYGLVVTFRLAKNHLKEHHLLAKFISIQLVLIFSNLQGSILDLLTTKDILPCVAPFYTKTRGLELNHLLLVLECFILSILLHHYYRKEALHRTALERDSSFRGDQTSPAEPSTIKDMFMTPARKLTLVSVLMAQGNHHHHNYRSPSNVNNPGGARAMSTFVIERDNNSNNSKAVDTPKISSPVLGADLLEEPMRNSNDRLSPGSRTAPHYKTLLLKGHHSRSIDHKFRRKSAGAFLNHLHHHQPRGLIHSCPQNGVPRGPSVGLSRKCSSSSPDSSNEYTSFKVTESPQPNSRSSRLALAKNEISLERVVVNQQSSPLPNLAERGAKVCHDVGVQYDGFHESYKPQF